MLSKNSNCNSVPMEKPSTLQYLLRNPSLCLRTARNGSIRHSAWCDKSLHSLSWDCLEALWAAVGEQRQGLGCACQRRTHEKKSAAQNEPVKIPFGRNSNGETKQTWPLVYYFSSASVLQVWSLTTKLKVIHHTISNSVKTPLVYCFSSARDHYK